MLNLNLLPPAYKKELRIERINRQVIYYGSSILSILIIFACLLGLINLFLFWQTKSLRKQISQIEAHLQIKQVQELEKSIRVFNQALINLAELQASQIAYSTILTQLTRLIPAGLQIQSFSLDNSGQIELTGYAPTREQLLNLKQSLEESPDFVQIEFPLSNLVKPKEIDFSFSFGVADFSLR